jgi:DNA-binding protein YbaB
VAREIDEAFIEEAIERYQRLEATRAEFEKAVSAAEVTVTSRDGLVEVRASADGAIRAVTIVGALGGRSNAELSRSVTEAVTSAADAARWARDRLQAEAFGAGSLR